jgi:hypothetical protein
MFAGSVSLADVFGEAKSSTNWIFVWVRRPKPRKRPAYQIRNRNTVLRLRLRLASLARRRAVQLGTLGAALVCMVPFLIVAPRLITGATSLS